MSGSTKCNGNNQWIYIIHGAKVFNPKNGMVDIDNLPLADGSNRHLVVQVIQSVFRTDIVVTVELNWQVNYCGLYKISTKYINLAVALETRKLGGERKQQLQLPSKNQITLYINLSCHWTNIELGILDDRLTLLIKYRNFTHNNTNNALLVLLRVKFLCLINRLPPELKGILTRMWWQCY